MNLVPMFNGLGLTASVSSKNSRFIATVDMIDNGVSVGIDGVWRQCTTAQWDELLEANIAHGRDDFSTLLRVWCALGGDKN